MYVTCVYTGNSENKRLRKPTKRLLESTEEYEQIFAPKKKSKKHTSESSKMVKKKVHLSSDFSSIVTTDVNMKC